MTVHAYSVQDAYIYGFALQESDMSFETPEDFAAEAAAADARLRRSALADYPHLVEVVGGHVAKAGYDYAPSSCSASTSSSTASSNSSARLTPEHGTGGPRGAARPAAGILKACPLPTHSRCAPRATA